MTCDTYFILTYHGTFLAQDTETGNLTHRTYEDFHGSSQLLEATLTASLRSDRLLVQCNIACSNNTFRTFDVIAIPERRVIHLCGSGLFFSADPWGETVCNRTDARGWETFLLISARELTDLSFIAQNRWIGPGELSVRETTKYPFKKEFRFHFGPHILDLSSCQPVQMREGLFELREGIKEAITGFRSFILVNDGWQIVCEMRLYRPLIYYAAFGSEDVFRQLFWSILSIINVGTQVEIHVISNKSREYVKKFLPDEVKESFSLQHLAAYDQVDYYLARYLIADYSKAICFQPIMYIDADVAINRGLDPLFEAIVYSDDLNAYQENFSPLETSDPVGAYLFKQDNSAVSGLMGFNSGCLAFASLREHGRRLRFISEIARSYIVKHGRSALRGDQPFANYVVFKTGGYNFELMNEYMTTGVKDDITTARIPANGLVHFWPARGQAKKAVIMREYVKQLIKCNPDLVDRELSSADDKCDT